MDRKLLKAHMTINGMNAKSLASLLEIPEISFHYKRRTGNFSAKEMQGIINILDLDQRTAEAIFFPE